MFITGKPLYAQIKLMNGTIQENMTARLICTVAGSNPEAQITWFHQGNQVKEGIKVRQLHLFLLSIIDNVISSDRNIRTKTSLACLY